jgi:predicted transcriptional regulator
MKNQILIQLSEGLSQRLDKKAAQEGRFRTAVAYDAIEQSLTNQGDRDGISRQIIDGYKRIPQIDEEPW